MPIRRLPRERPRAVVATGLAVVLHGALVLGGLRARTPPRAVAPAPVVLDPVAITLLDEPDRALAETDPARVVAPAGASIAIRQASAAENERAFAPAPMVAPPERGVPETEATAAIASAPVMLFAAGPAAAPAIGIAGDGLSPYPGAARATGRGPERPAPDDGPRSAHPPAPGVADAKRAADRVLQEGLRARDLEVGLGPEGPVLRALEDAAYAGLAPAHGSATFLAVIDANGLVVDLRLVGSKGGEPGWLDARARAARVLAGKRLELRGAKGGELRIAVDSDVLLPAGAEPTKAVRPTLKDSRAVIPQNVPAGGTADVVKTNTVAEFDLSDIAGKPRHIVHARRLSWVAL